MIKEFTKCEDCAHQAVCLYKSDKKEILEKMIGKLDNECCPETFEFCIKCKEFHPQNLSLIRTH